MAKQTAPKVLTVIHASPAKFRIVDAFRGRSAPVSDDALVALADSLRTRGQEQPVKARPVAGTDEYEIIFGNTRKRAADLIVNGYTDGQGKEVKPNPDFKLRAEVGEFTDEEAFTSNVVENAQRNQCTAIDNMYNQQKLRDDYGMTDAAIARLYGQDQAWVNRLKGLQVLPQGYLDEIHKGNLTVSAAFLLTGKAGADVREANAYDALWMLLHDENGENPVHGGAARGSTDMANAIKEWRKQQQATVTPTPETPTTPEGTTSETGTPPAGETSTPTPDGTTAGSGVKAIPLTMKQVKDAFKAVADSTVAPEKIKTFSSMFLQFIGGELDGGVFIREVEKLMGIERTPVEPPADTPAETAPEAAGGANGTTGEDSHTENGEAPTENGAVNDPPASEHGVERPTRRKPVTRKP